jgi:phage terminase Nu1 subunit (DNA packaging protein)
MSKQAGYKAVERCEIPIVDGTVDPDVATVLYRKRTRARTNERPPQGAAAGAAGSGGAPGDVPAPSSGDDYWHSRGRRERAEAELAELKLAEQRGELVRAADVRASLAKRLSALREAILQLPARVVPLLAADPTPAAMDATLRAEIVAALTHLVEARDGGA